MLVAIEGIDGAGKGTQCRLLQENIRATGRTSTVISFPRYKETIAGRMIGEYLNGSFGADVHPKLAAMMYAVDRKLAMGKIEFSLRVCDLVVLDRWVGSNLAHQAARMKTQEEADALTAWIEDLEWNEFSVRVPDLTILLTVNQDAAVLNIEKKPVREYTEKSKDIHEADSNHLSATQERYLKLARKYGWAIVDTMIGDTQRTIESISKEILQLVAVAMDR